MVCNTHKGVGKHGWRGHNVCSGARFCVVTAHRHPVRPVICHTGRAPFSWSTEMPIPGFYVVRNGEWISGPHGTRIEADAVARLTEADTIEEVKDDEQTQAGSATAPCEDNAAVSAPITAESAPGSGT